MTAPPFLPWCGAFMGTRINTGNLDEALDAAIEQAFNAGVAVGIEHTDPA